LGAFGRGCLHSLPAMPVHGKQVEENPLLWVFSSDFLIQLRAKPCSAKFCGWSEGNIFDLRLLYSYNYMVL
jgi:hypothetical protein